MNDYDLTILVLRQHYPGLGDNINDPAYNAIEFPKLIEFLKNGDNFSDSNFTAESREVFIDILNDMYNKLSSGPVSDSAKPERYVCKTFLNYYQADAPRKFKELSYELEDVGKKGSTAGVNYGSFYKHKKEKNEGERLYFVKGTKWPVKELYFSWLFRAFVPGTPPVKVSDKGKGVVASKVMGGKPIDRDTDPEGMAYLDSVGKENTGLPENLLLSMLTKDSDFNDRNILQSPTGKFVRIDFERVGFGVYDEYRSIDKFSLSEMNFSDGVVIPYIGAYKKLEGSDGLFSTSSTFTKDIYKAIIKIAMYPKEVIRQQFEEAKAMLGKDNIQFDLDGFFKDRDMLIKLAMRNMGFMGYIKKEANFDVIFTELAIAENGKGRARIIPYEKQMIKQFKKMGGCYKKKKSNSAGLGKDNINRERFSFSRIFGKGKTTGQQGQEKKSRFGLMKKN